MKKRLVIIGTIGIFAITSIGGLAFAQNRGRLEQNQPEVKPIIRNFDGETIIRDDNRAELQLEEQIVEIKEVINNNNENANRYDDFGYGNENMIDQHNQNHNIGHDLDMNQDLDYGFEHHYEHDVMHEEMYSINNNNHNQTYNTRSNQTHNLNNLNNTNYNSMHNSRMDSHGGRMGHGSGRHR